MKITKKRYLMGSAAGLAMGLIASAAAADIVHLNDVIVDGSLCVGFDCVNNEAFGSDTIRLKENNTRIKFQDTSVGSFASNDWQLTANSSANGGQNKFSIDDVDTSRAVFTVEAGARTNALYVESDGDVGIGTASPAVELHAVNGNTPTLRLDQDTSSGFAAQVWDIAGNETSFFVRDVSNGSTLPFRIRPGAPSQSLAIDTDGDVGIGTLTSTASLHVKRTGANASNVLIEASTGDASFELKQVGATPAQWEFRNQAGSGRLNVGLVGGNTPLKIDSTADNNLLKLGITGNTDAVVVTGELLVNGTTMNVPDYVFDESYQLMPLSELNAFIEANNHLPRIPSAADVQRDGLNLPNMQLALLEKVEELTLYTLEQQRTIDRLAVHSADQQQTIDELKALYLQR